MPSLAWLVCVATLNRPCPTMHPSLGLHRCSRECGHMKFYKSVFNTRCVTCIALSLEISAIKNKSLTLSSIMRNARFMRIAQGELGMSERYACEFLAQHRKWIYDILHKSCTKSTKKESLIRFFSTWCHVFFLLLEDVKKSKSRHLGD